MERKLYHAPVAEFVYLDENDVIRTSPPELETDSDGYLWSPWY